MSAVLYAFDVETNIVDGDAGAWREGTYVVLSGTCTSTSDGPAIAPGLTAYDELCMRVHARDGFVPHIVAGHNLPFDLCHVLKARGDAGLRWLLSPRAGLWDTQIADYLMSGSAHTWPTLEESGARFDVHIEKDAWASDAFARGIGADVLMAEDAARLRAYLRSDLVGTLLLAQRQRAKLREMPRLIPVVRTQMRVIKLVVLCQHFGMPIDPDTLQTAAEATRRDLDANAAVLRGAVEALLEHPTARAQFNLDSPAQLAALLYGGDITYTTRTQIGTYMTGAKVGQPRYSLTDHVVKFPARVKGRGTGEDILLAHAAATETPAEVRALITPLLRNRELGKLDDTYYTPIGRKIKQSTDGRLHGNFNMASTNTGRKSSDGPNLQNIPDSVRAAIKAPPGYVILAADGKQLEVVGLGYMSGDPKLRAVLLSPERLTPGKDVHGVVNRRANERSGHEIKRTNVKRVVFGRFYGGGAVTLSAQSGLPVEIVRTILKELDAAFPTAAQFFKRVKLALESRRVCAAGQPDTAMYTLPSGRLLHFTADDAGEFSYTQMKNRPIQSFATADIIPFFEQCLVAWLAQDITRITDRRVLPFALVHDEMVLQVRADAVEEVRGFFRSLQTRVVPMLNKWYGLRPAFDLPLDISAGVGASWLEAKENAEVIK